MTSNNTSISVTYTNQQLRILIEEFIAMQRSEFTFKGVCSYILYRAMEEGRTAGKGIYESNQLDMKDCEELKVFWKRLPKKVELRFLLINQLTTTNLE